jgi:hypothetical protein
MPHELLHGCFLLEVFQVKKTIEDLAVSHYNAGTMCTGCFVRMIAPRDINYKCPVCGDDE